MPTNKPTLTPKQLDVPAQFEAELRTRGLVFRRDEEGGYRIDLDAGEITASLENIRRNVERDGDVSAIARFVDQIVSVMATGDRPFEDAARHLYFLAESAEVALGESIRTPVSAEVVRALTLSDAAFSAVTFVTPRMCARWGVTEQVATARARANQDRLIDSVELQVAESEGERLGMVPVDAPYKASVIFAPSFRRMVEPSLGWPVLAVLPCRDFLYVVRDQSPLLSSMGAVVVGEYRASGYPITTEVLRIGDDGIRAIGAYPR